MNNNDDLGTARGSNFTMFRWSFSLAKRKLKDLQDTIFSTKRKERIPKEVNILLPTIHHHVLVDVNVPVVYLNENEKLIMEFQ
jgi:hypothetical protein